MKGGSTSSKSQFTFENEEFVVSASFLGDFSDEEVSSNPDATTVKRGELDFEDLHDVHLLDESIGDNIVLSHALFLKVFKS